MKEVVVRFFIFLAFVTEKDSGIGGNCGLVRLVWVVFLGFV